VHHQYQQIDASINDSSCKFATSIKNTLTPNFATSSASVVDTGGKDAGGKLPLVSTTPAANFPLVSMTPVTNNGNNIRLLTT
jgi:hypothetical protein